jgi:hypothetical protein
VSNDFTEFWGLDAVSAPESEPDRFAFINKQQGVLGDVRHRSVADVVAQGGNAEKSVQWRGNGRVRGVFGIDRRNEPINHVDSADRVLEPSVGSSRKDVFRDP